MGTQAAFTWKTKNVHINCFGNYNTVFLPTLNGL